MFNISIIKCLTDNYSYLLKDEITNTVGIVDPSEFTTVDKEIERKYKKLELKKNYYVFLGAWNFKEYKKELSEVKKILTSKREM